VHYEEDNLTEVTPSFDTTKMNLEIGYANKILDLDLTAKQIAELLAKAG